MWIPASKITWKLGVYLISAHFSQFRTYNLREILKWFKTLDLFGLLLSTEVNSGLDYKIERIKGVNNFFLVVGEIKHF